MTTREELSRALTALYLVVDESVAVDVSKKVHEALRLVEREALEWAASDCELFHKERVRAVEEGAEHRGILLGEASGATHCANAIRARMESMGEGVSKDG